MLRRSTPVPATDPSLPVRLDQPHDTCFRCGRPTPPGVSLCEIDNPGRIKSPSATQVHGTIVLGVLAGFIGLFLIFRLATPGNTSFATSLAGVASRADGGLDVVVSVTNSGTGSASASCAVAPGGVPDYQDYVFFTGPIPVGQTRQFTLTLPAPQGGSQLNTGSAIVRCR